MCAENSTSQLGGKLLWPVLDKLLYDLTSGNKRSYFFL